MCVPCLNLQPCVSTNVCTPVRVTRPNSSDCKPGQRATPCTFDGFLWSCARTFVLIKIRGSRLRDGEAAERDAVRSLNSDDGREKGCDHFSPWLSVGRVGVEVQHRTDRVEEPFTRCVKLCCCCCGQMIGVG